MQAYNAIKFRTILPLLIGGAVFLVVYFIPHLNRLLPPRSLRARLAVVMSMSSAGVAALIALFFNPHFISWSFNSVLLSIIVVVCFQTAFKINRLSVRGALNSWRMLLDIHNAFLDNDIYHSRAPLIVVKDVGVFGAIYAAHIPSFLSRFSDYRHKVPVYTFLSVEYLECVSEVFRDWVISNADACLLIEGFGRDEDQSAVAKFDFLCWGKSNRIHIDVWSNAQGVRRAGNHPPNDGGLEVSITHSFPYLNAGQEIKLAPIVHNLYNCTAVIHREELRVREMMPTIDAIRRSAFQPIAKAYVRFRHSSSDTERLLGLFDCFDAIIKTSAVIFIASRRAEGSDLVKELFAKKASKAALENLSAGDWIAMVRRGVATSSKESRAETELCSFWNGALQDPYIMLIDAVNASGLAGEFNGERSHSEWLAWLVNFRNKTRGHGVVRESTSMQIWPLFHECFLSTVQQLPSVVLNLSVEAGLATDRFPVPNGWSKRAESPATASATSLIYLDTDHPSGRFVDVSPFLYLDGDNLYLLSGKNGARYTYLDYSTGRSHKNKC